MTNPTTNTKYGEHVIDVTTTGSAASATGESNSEKRAFGFVYQISVNFDPQAPATTNVRIHHTLRNGISQTLGYLDTTATDIIWSPQYDATSIGTVSTPPTANGEKRWPLVLNSLITVTVTGCDALTNAVRVSIQVI